VERVRQPEQPPQVRTALRVGGLRGNAVGREPVAEVQEHRAGLVHLLGPLPQRRDAPQRVHVGEVRDLVATPRVDVDRRVLAADLLERRTCGERARAGDLE
jgi:hypothetical protein